MKIKQIKHYLEESLKPKTAYMVRNDGELLEVSGTHPYLTNGDLTEPLDKVENYFLKLLNFYLEDLEWVYKHISDNFSKQQLDKLMSTLVYGNIYKIKDNLKMYIKNTFDVNDDVFTSKTDFLQAWKLVNYNFNQEFLRMRTSDRYFGGKSHDVYFRISSVGFDWYNIIWEIVVKNKNWISTITIEDDVHSKEGKLLVDHEDVNDFINSKPRVLEDIKVEDKYSIIKERLLHGDTFTESFSLTSYPVVRLLQDTYDNYMGKQLKEHWYDVKDKLIERVE